MLETEDDLLVEISRTLIRLSPVLLRMAVLRKPARISPTVCRQMAIAPRNQVGLKNHVFLIQELWKDIRSLADHFY